MWNFNEFLAGRIVARRDSRTTPEAKELKGKVKETLDFGGVPGWNAS